MRKLIVSRERKMNGAGVPFYVCVDGKVIGKVENGETEIFTIGTNAQRISVFADMLDGRHNSYDYPIRPGNSDCKYRIYRKVRLIAKDDMHLEEIWFGFLE